MPRACPKHGCEIERRVDLGRYLCVECARELDAVGRAFAAGAITKRQAREQIAALDLPEMWYLEKI